MEKIGEKSSTLIAKPTKGIEMNNLNPHRHFFLYAKGHYKTGVILEDLGKICTAYLQGRMMIVLNDQNYPLRAIISNELGSRT